MDIKDIKAIYKFLRETDIVEFELEGPEGKVRLKRGNAYAVQEAIAAPAAAPEEAKSVEAAKNEKARPDNIKVVTSPMVGTFYRRRAFHRDGQRRQEGTGPVHHRGYEAHERNRKRV